MKEIQQRRSTKRQMLKHNLSRNLSLLLYTLTDLSHLLYNPASPHYAEASAALLLNLCRQNVVEVLKAVMTFTSTTCVTPLSLACHETCGAWRADRWKSTLAAARNVKLLRCGCASHLQLRDASVAPRWKIHQALC